MLHRIRENGEMIENMLRASEDPAHLSRRDRSDSSPSPSNNIIVKRM